MLKNIVILFFLLFGVSSVAQRTDSNFKITLDSLKTEDNFSEFIYRQLDAYAKNATIENLKLFEDVSTNLWRNPKNTSETTAQLYLHINYAFYLKQFGFINQSILEYEKAFAIYNTNIQFDIIEYCLKPLANNYTRLGDVDRAEDILKITIEKAQKEQDTSQLIAGYSNLATVFRTKGDYLQAITYLNLSLNLSTENQLKARVYSDLAINFLYLKDIEKAKKNVQFSNQFNVDSNSSILAKNRITLANCFVQLREFDQAIIELEDALKNARKAFGEHDREVAKIYNQLAEVYGQTNQLENGLTYYQKSLSTLLPKYQPKTVFENPKATYFYPENTLKEALDGRAQLFIQQNDFENALKNYELAFKVEDELRASLLSQNAKVIQQQENRNRSENCIDLCYELYQQTKTINWLEKAFHFAELSKSAVLLEAKEAAFQKSTIKNDSLFIIEKDLTFKKAQLNKSITIEELKGKKASINLLADLTNRRNIVFNELQLVKQQIKKKYPSLAIRNDSLISFKSIKEKLLVNNEQFIEFFDGKEYVYIFYISKTAKPKLDKIVKDTTFKYQISQFLSLFADSRGTALQNNVAKYTSLGYELFRKIITIELPKNTIIVPDGVFSFLPFDALITEKTVNTNFEKLPYLLKKSRISFAYSASVLMYDAKIKENTKDSFIGFFPVFENNHRKLAELTYTLQESESVKNSMKGTFLLKENASKEVFNTLVKKYEIVHLSTHATSGDYYTPPAIEFYDETLYLPEIYGYNLETDLLVLSACETGLGTLRKGEGAMSLARGFSYAGVKNLLVSLWKVNDKSTERLMAAFYKNYKNTGNKSAALHHSKLAYLENKSIVASKKSPFYWASFIYIGEVTSFENKGFNFMWILFLGILVLVGYFLLKKR
ncbi:MAG: CHAT domain-containing protein [Lutibacter sp.]|uniref:CHAT domain-containing protein n=1 Tax=Lutibacter sp. TaxID=1925666 RepID=UPI0018151B41|nr:CHAT domain-containing protein [Lutibacter sp.]MBT8318339.1 CHAT domain-containing protein [Lutibacter sp.]NNJ59197.1 CHAT domain-containing protein [Lutibacter sp.]